MPRPKHRKHLGERFSEGARMLWRAIEKNGLPMRAVAEAVGPPTVPGDVCRWLYGDHRPTLRALMALEQAYRIPLSAWTVAPRRPFVPPAARAA